MNLKTTDMPIEIFSNVQFADRFLTRDGRKAIFLRFWGKPVSSAFLYIDKWGEEEYQLNGMRVGDTAPSGWDMVTPCRADGWEPLPTERERLTLELSAAREMLASCPNDLLMRTSWENRIKYLEEQLENLND